MNRRRFLELFAGAGVAKAATHFLPPIGGWGSDVIVNPAPVLPETCVLPPGLRCSFLEFEFNGKKMWLPYWS